MSQPWGPIATAKYVQLTTFRKDGTPVSSPLWAALDGDALVVWTVADSWKVKRLRRDPRAIVQACDARGKKLEGAPVSGRAQILDREGGDHVRSLIARKYGVFGWVTIKVSGLRRGNSGTVGVSITPSDE